MSTESSIKTVTFLEVCISYRTDHPDGMMAWSIFLKGTYHPGACHPGSKWQRQDSHARLFDFEDRPSSLR